jgi:dolichol-phosphate mannosyltransferase
MPDLNLSVIVPIYNEEKVLPLLKDRLIAVLEKLKLSYEVIFVDDCSQDNSPKLLREFNAKNSKVKILSFSRNFGHQTAITAGLNFSSGKAVMVIDGDLQDPPEIIPAFLEKWKDGFEVVYGIRKTRDDNIIKKNFCNMYYRLLKMLSSTDIALDSGDCCLMDRRVADILNEMPERNRFIRGLRRWVGFRQTGVEYDRDKRYAGKSKYTFFKLLKLALDGIISFSDIPLKISVFLGFFISIASLLYSFYIVWNRIFNPTNQIPGWTSIITGITFLGGIQLMVMGFLGEYIVRIFDEVKCRPQYIVNRAVGFTDKDAEGLSNNSSP